MAESKRLAQLEKAFAKAIDASFRKTTTEDVCKQFPADMQPMIEKTVPNYWKALKQSVTKNVTNELAVICTERDMDAKLLKLEKLLDTQPAFEDGSTLSNDYFSVNPEAVARERRMQRKLKEKARLEAQLQEVLGESQQQKAVVQGKRDRVKELSEELKRQREHVSEVLVSSNNWPTIATVEA